MLFSRNTDLLISSALFLFRWKRFHSAAFTYVHFSLRNFICIWLFWSNSEPCSVETVTWGVQRSSCFSYSFNGIIFHLVWLLGMVLYRTRSWTWWSLLVSSTFASFVILLPKLVVSSLKLGLSFLKVKTSHLDPEGRRIVHSWWVGCMSAVGPYLSVTVTAFGQKRVSALIDKIFFPLFRKRFLLLY